MKNLLLLAILLVASIAEANTAVVKVLSSRCGTARGLKMGSGTLIRTTSGVMVITSDHVLYHGDKAQGVCHRILADGKDVPASLIAVNSFKGLALLRPEDGRVSGAALSTDGMNLPVSEGGFAQLAGFPASSRNLIADRNAQILASASDRKILPGVSSVIEVKGHSEYGMSGGALFDYEGRYAGMISHQYLRLQLGAPTTIHTHEEGAAARGQEMIALVIPGATVLTWIEDALQGQGDVRFDAMAQLNREEVMVLDGMRFTLQSGCQNQQKGPVGGEGAGIGGRGGEGAGIGGNGTNASGCEIHVALDRSGQSGASGIKAQWYAQLKEKLLAGATARITGTFYKRQRFPVRPLIAFFASVNSGHIPLLEVETPFVAANFVEASAQKKADEIRAVLDLLKQNELPAVAGELIQDCENLLEAARMRQWELVEIRPILDDSGWQSLMTKDFSRAVELRSKLLQLAEIVRQIRL